MSNKYNIKWLCLVNYVGINTLKDYIYYLFLSLTTFHLWKRSSKNIYVYMFVCLALIHLVYTFQTDLCNFIEKNTLWIYNTT